jgi:ABC-type multidrug transport system fused ATPase/permease subunit
MPLASFANQQPGEAISHVLNDVQGVGGAVSDTLVDIVDNMFVLTATTLFVFALDWRLGQLALSFLPLFISPTRRPASSRKRFRSRARCWSRFSGARRRRSAASATRPARSRRSP